MRKFLVLAAAAAALFVGVGCEFDVAHTKIKVNNSKADDPPGRTKQMVLGSSYKTSRGVDE